MLGIAIGFTLIAIGIWGIAVMVVIQNIIENCKEK